MSKSDSEESLSTQSSESTSEISDVTILSTSKQRHTYKSKSQWIKYIKHIRQNSSARFNCSKLAAGLIRLGMFGRAEPASSQPSNFNDFSYNPQIVIRCQQDNNRVKKEEVEFNSYYATVNDSHILHSEAGVTALLPYQRIYKEQDGVVDLVAPSEIDRENYFADYLHKDDLLTHLENKAVEHGGWLVGVIGLSRVLKLSEKLAKDIIENLKPNARGLYQLDATQFSKHCKKDLPEGHIMVFQYLANASTPRKGTPQFMLSEPQNLIQGKVKDQLIYESIHEACHFVSTQHPLNHHINEFDSNISVLIFHSPKLAKGLSPENLKIKVEMSK